MGPHVGEKEIISEEALHLPLKVHKLPQQQKKACRSMRRISQTMKRVFVWLTDKDPCCGYTVLPPFITKGSVTSGSSILGVDLDNNDLIIKYCTG